MKSICVFSGSSSGTDPVYRDTAFGLGAWIASQGSSVIYGGASVGLMGAVADGALSKGGQVFGVLPENLQLKELAHPGLTKLYKVNSMHERKQMMFDLSEGIIALPGGLGTYEELFEVLTWAQLGLHAKPVGILNVRGFYNALFDHLEIGMTEGFVRKQHRDMILIDSDIEKLWDKMSNYQPPSVEKWINRGQT